MRSLEEFDKDSIPDGVIKKLRRYIDDPTYTPGAQCMSGGCEGRGERGPQLDGGSAGSAKCARTFALISCLLLAGESSARR
jgi:hypothetical protein